MKTSCPHCKQQVEVDDQWAGQSVACPTCNGQIVLPRLTSPPPSVAAPPPPFVAAPPPHTSPTPSRGSNAFKYAALACGGVIALMLCVIVIVLITRDGSPVVAGDSGASSAARQQARMRSAIESVMATDNQMFDRMNSSVSSGTPPAQAIASYAARLKSIDMSQCPPEFREAYLRHANAWQGLGMQIDKEPQSFIESVLYGFLNGLRGEFDGGLGRLQREHDSRFEAVVTTWGEVEAIAVRYGARLQSQ